MEAIKLIKESEYDIKRKFGVSKIGVFGSFAEGKETPRSDVDVLVEFKQGFETFDNYEELKFFLEDLFGRKVDLVTVDALKPLIKDDILRQVNYA